MSDFELEESEPSASSHSVYSAGSSGGTFTAKDVTVFDRMVSASNGMLHEATCSRIIQIFATMDHFA